MAQINGWCLRSSNRKTNFTLTLTELRACRVYCVLVGVPYECRRHLQRADSRLRVGDTHVPLLVQYNGVRLGCLRTFIVSVFNAE